MQFLFKFVMAVTLAGSAVCAFALGGFGHAISASSTSASSVSGPSVSKNAVAEDGVSSDSGDKTEQSQIKLAAKKEKEEKPRLTLDDRLSLLAAALDARVQRDAEPDCSHLVHAIYKAAGFPYTYAPSADLYEGVESFERVKAPLPGDLVVWRGHVGIVTKPSEHAFFSYLSSGPGTDDYEAPYWKRRGRARFYRYVKDSVRAGE